jgi:hypothetical protein
VRDNIFARLNNDCGGPTLGEVMEGKNAVYYVDAG